MGRVYTFAIASEAISAAGDMLQLKAADDMAFKILSIETSQENIEGDAAADQLLMVLERRTGTVTDGSGGTTSTGVRKLPTDTVAVVIGLANNTTDASGGTLEELGRWAWYMGAGFEKVYPEKEQPAFAAGNGATAESVAILRLVNSPDASTTFNGQITIEEIG